MYTVPEYLDMMERAGHSPKTIRAYTTIFRSFAKFLKVPVEEIHDHILPANLIKYAGSMKHLSPLTSRERLAIIRAYFEENGVSFSKLERKVLSPHRAVEPDDKPLTLEILQKMMDVGDDRTRAYITVLVSTGMRGWETANLKLSDVDGDTITIPNAIAKGKKGGKVYLNAEAREYLDIFLKNRDKYIARSEMHAAVFHRAGITPPRPEGDDRIFGASYTALEHAYMRAYKKIDGERGKYRHRITPHSCRKYFRTQLAAGGLNIDIVDKLMRHTGAYLSGAYVRLTDAEIKKAYHDHEHALYITRPEQRGAVTALAIEKQKREEVEKRTEALEQKNKILEERLNIIEDMDGLKKSR